MSQRFAVRRRPDGWATVDTEGLILERRFASRDAAERLAARQEAALQPTSTYAVVWYCEVDALTESDAVEKARKFLAPSYRENWEPVSVDEVAPR